MAESHPSTIQRGQSLTVQPPDYTYDADRLAALARYDILDTPSEPGFDDIVQLASLICEAPIALVSLVDGHRQWFKARLCFDVVETGLDSSICAHALIEPGLLVIPDLTQDARSKNNPLVTQSPHIRFYAGAPFRAATGEVLGSLCIIDTKPRPGGLTAAQAVCLTNLGRQVSSQLELRRALAERDAFAAEQQQAHAKRNSLVELAEAQQEILNQELSHRLKNTFAIIQAIATQTLRGVADRQPVDAFVQRLHALSAAHDVLLQKRWAAAKLGDIVASVIAAMADIARFDLSGPDVDMGPRATLSVSLLLHELTTNAIKYGALSNAAGRVRITWRLEESDAGPELMVGWLERGGPPVATPSRGGFGSKLIRVGLVGTGGVSLRYIASGFEAEFRAPLAKVQLS